MKSRLLLFTWAFLTSCVQVGVRAPLNYRNMMACREAIDARQLSDEVIQKLTDCIPQADAFVKSQETYKLDADEQIRAFEALRLISMTTDHGTRGLEEVYTRLSEKDRTPQRAEQVFQGYVRERDFKRARAFAAAFQNSPKVIIPTLKGPVDEGHMNLLRVTSENSLKYEVFRMPKGAHILVVFSPLCAECRELHEFLIKNKDQMGSAFGSINYVGPSSTPLVPEVLSWPKKNSVPKYGIVYKAAPFPRLNWYSVPTIYFMLGENVKFRIDGWSPSSGPDQWSTGLLSLQ